MPNPAIMTMQGLPTYALACEAAVMSLSAGAPSYQFRADTVTLSAGNVATIPNRRGSDALVLSAGTLAAPAADALFGGAQSIAFTGTQHLTSNLPASAFRFLHDGTGFEMFTVFVPTMLDSNRTLIATISSYALTAVGIGTSTNITPFAQVLMPNGTSAVLNLNVLGPALNTPAYHNVYHGLSQPLNYGLFWKETAAITGNSTNTPASGDPNGTLRLAATLNGANFGRMKWGETLIFPRVLHEYERQIVREYIAARYGIAAPSLTGADRDIMSMLPFAYFDPFAANVSGGKVTAFLDRARPGHTWAQASGTLQVATPAADAGINGASAATFVTASSTRYVSSLAISAWRFMHGNGNGCEWRAAWNATANGKFVFATNNGSGAGCNASQQTAQVGWTTLNASQALFATTAGGSSPLSTWVVTGGSCGPSASPTWDARAAGAVGASGSYVNTPGNVDSGVALTIGTFGNGTFGFDGKLSIIPIFNRILTASERSKLAAAITAKLGLAA